MSKELPEPPAELESIEQHASEKPPISDGLEWRGVAWLGLAWLENRRTGPFAHARAGECVSLQPRPRQAKPSQERTDNLTTCHEKSGRLGLAWLGLS